MSYSQTSVRTIEMTMPDGQARRSFHYSKMAPHRYPDTYNHPIHVCIVYVSKHPEKIDMLVKQIRDQGNEERQRKLVNKKDELGMTPLHTAVYFRSIDLCKVLLSFGADINAKNDWDYTPLFLALGGVQDLEMGRELLNKGADPNIKAKLDSGEQWSIFHLATLMNRMDILKLLVKYGADPSPALFDGLVPLHLALTPTSKSCIMSLSRRYSRKKENNLAICEWCGKRKGLRRCKDCYITFYCNKLCQEEHWNYSHHKNCPKSIDVGLKLQEVLENKQYKDITDTHMLYTAGLDEKQYPDMWSRSRKQLQLVQGKYFVCKVGFEIGRNNMAFSNEDLTIHSVLYANENGHLRLSQELADAERRNEDYLFLWATPLSPKHNTIKVFPGKRAPWQLW